jgi:uncharacterized surface protein with fasciclin (FAS1) repeats
MEKTTASGATRTIRMMMLSATLIGVVACDDDDTKTTGGQSDVVATADAAGSFETLVAAIRAAELETTLKGAGPFTVFAPTDAAFAKIPAATLNELLLPANKATLQAILTYHVVAGKVMAADVVSLTSATTVQGSTVAVSVNGATVKVNDATVTQTDVAASNGVIHVIDTVLMPPGS